MPQSYMQIVKEGEMSVSDILAVVGLVVSVGGIPLTFLLARRARQRPQLRYRVDFRVILRLDDELFRRGFLMTLGGRKIDSISRTRIALWNHHGDTIEKQDNLESDPLRIQLDAGEALQAHLLCTSRYQTGLSVARDEADPASVKLTFDFLDAGDGGVVEIIQHGTKKPVIRGTLKGCTIREAGNVDLSQNGLKAITTPRMLRFWNYGKPGIKWTARIFIFLTIGTAIWGLIYSFLTQSGTSLYYSLLSTCIFIFLEFTLIYLGYRSLIPESITRYFVTENETL